MQTDAKKTKKPGVLCIPSYRFRKGYNQAIVTLRDAQTRRAKDYWLGEYDSPESHEAYNRVIAAWINNKRRLPLPELVTAAHRDQSSLTVKEVLLAYWKHAQPHAGNR